MRLLPCASDNSDFAETSELLDHVSSSKNTTSKSKGDGAASSGLSFLVWLALAGAIPAVVYQEFGEKWMVHYTKYGEPLIKQYM